MRRSPSHIARWSPIVLVAALTVWPAASWGWGSPRSGGFGASVVRGGPGADFLRGAEGHDRVYGRGGDDLLTGDTGPDLVVGGAGGDTLSGGSGIDVLRGGDGDDIASGGFGADLIDGGAGGDALDGDQDADTILGGPGDDLLHGGSGIDRIDGGTGSDRIFADSGGDFIDGGDGNDVIIVDGAVPAHITCGAGRDTVYLTVPASATADYAGIGTAGTRSKDCEIVQLTDAVQDPNRGLTYLAADAGGTRSGTARDDVLLGGPGADTLRGLGGNDVLWGLRQAGMTSTKPDVISAGPGDDTVYGGPGPQRITGGPGDDFLEGGLGDGTIDGGGGDDTIRLRGAGAVRVRAGSGRDTIYARGAARAVIGCGAGRDVAHVDAGDVVARDCERVIGTPARRVRRVAARAAATLRAATGSPAYADLVAATPGLTHWWRMSPSEQVNSPFGVAYGSGLIDKVTKSQGAYFNTPTTQGPTDDGDTAYEIASWDAGQPLYTNVPDTELIGPAFTFEGWYRSDDSGTARVLLNDVAQGGTDSGVALVREPDGSLRAQIRSFSDPRRVDLRSPALDLGTTWHHIALTRTDSEVAIYVDGASVADGPAEPVTTSYPSYSWYIGAKLGDYGAWLGAIDEVATYDRALDAAAIRAHARVGEDGVAPVTRTSPPFGAFHAPTSIVQFVTDKGGSTFRCGLDGAPLAPCRQQHQMTNLAGGQHVLRVQAIDRFGVTEATPAELRFAVDTQLPHSLALVRLASDGARQAVVALGSDKPVRTYECAINLPGEAAFPPGLTPDFFYSPCASGNVAVRGSYHRVRAVDVAGNRDPIGTRLFVPPPGQGFAGPEAGLPTFAGQRVEVGIIGQQPYEGLAKPFECRIDGAPWSRCPFAFRLPILHSGRHTLQARQRLAGTNAVATTDELAMTVAPSSDPTTIVGLQTPLVIERGAALRRRAPRVRFALNRPATLRIELVVGGRRLFKVVAAGATGPNVVKLPAHRLAQLPTGRYGLVLTARGSSGPVATQRLPLAIVRPLR